jgi:hypothetical protein
LNPLGIGAQGRTKSVKLAKLLIYTKTVSMFLSNATKIQRMIHLNALFESSYEVSLGEAARFLSI